MVDRALNGPWISGFAKLDKSSTFTQDIPDNLTDPVCNGPDGLGISEAGDDAFEDRLQMASVGPGGGLGRLTQQASQEPIPFGGSPGMILAGALIGAGADTDPGG